jgi:hypothetical protein
MTIAAAFLGGAKSRLLPPSVPFRFFAAAAVFHVLLWLALLLAAGHAASFTDDFGPALAAIHLLTLGVLTTTAIGAATQILPVATRRALTGVRLVKLVFWLTVPGIAMLTAAMYSAQQHLLLAGAGITATGLAVFTWLFANNLRRAGTQPMAAAYAWAALASLVALVGLGVTLAFNRQFGMLPNPAGVALAHMLLGGFGFMGLLAVGFSYILIPMFALAPTPANLPSLAIFVAAIVAIAAGVFGALTDSRVALASAALMGLATAGGYLWTMYRVLVTGMRKHLGLSFILVRGAWIMLPTALLAGLASIYGIAGNAGPALFGFLLLFGWLLTFMLGILQRILPFLASMSVTPPAKGGTAIASVFADAATLKVHAMCHALALAGLVAAIIADNATLARLGSTIGLIGAVAFAWFTADVIRRMAQSTPGRTGK